MLLRSHASSLACCFARPPPSLAPPHPPSLPVPSGTLKFPDVAPDCDGEFESEFRIDSKITPPQARPLLERFIKNDHGSFKEEVQKAINGWIKEFQGKYS